MTPAEHLAMAKRILAAVDRGEEDDGTPILREHDRHAISLATSHALTALVSRLLDDDDLAVGE